MFYNSNVHGTALAPYRAGLLVPSLRQMVQVTVRRKGTMKEAGSDSVAQRSRFAPSVKLAAFFHMDMGL